MTLYNGLLLRDLYRLYPSLPEDAEFQEVLTSANQGRKTVQDPYDPGKTIPSDQVLEADELLQLYQNPQIERKYPSFWHYIEKRVPTKHYATFVKETYFPNTIMTDNLWKDLESSINTFKNTCKHHI